MIRLGFESPWGRHHFSSIDQSVMSWKVRFRARIWANKYRAKILPTQPSAKCHRDIPPNLVIGIILLLGAENLTRSVRPCIESGEKCEYFSVCVIVEWPSHCCKSKILPPHLINSLAKVCRSEWKVARRVKADSNPASFRMRLNFSWQRYS